MGLSLSFVANTVNPKHTDEGALQTYRNRLAHEHFVVLEHFFTAEAFKALRDEASAILDDAQRRDFIMGTYETPRAMSVVGGRTIFSKAPKLASVYYAFPVCSLLSRIVGQTLNLSGQVDAFMTINHLETIDDTQGWHLDDGSHAVIFSFVTPEPGDGGELEYIVDWPNRERGYKRQGISALDDMIAKARSDGAIRSINLPENACYILKSDTSLHRVAPLRSSTAQRTVMAAGYEVDRVTKYSHTGADLYEGA